VAERQPRGLPVLGAVSDQDDPYVAGPVGVKAVVGFYGVYDVLAQWHHNQDRAALDCRRMSRRVESERSASEARRKYSEHFGIKPAFA
jgi:hypothetical protein